MEYPTSSNDLYCLFSKVNDAGLIESVGTTEFVLTEQNIGHCKAMPW